MQTSPDPRTIILNLLKGAVPERIQEISEHWNTYNPSIEVVANKTGVTMNANKHRIQFDTKTLDVFWLIGFSAWRSIETYSPAIFIGTITQTSLEAIMKVDADLPLFEKEYKARMATAQSIISGTETNLDHWPPDIPKPQHDPDLQNPQDKVALDLVGLALAFSSTNFATSCS